MARELTGADAVKDNQSRAAALGVAIPGVGGSTGTPVIPVAETQTGGSARPTIPTPPPATSSTGLLGTIGANADQFTKDLAAQAQGAEKGRTDSFQQLIASLAQTEGKSSLTDSLYRSEGVDSSKDELKDINNQILSEQTGLRHRLEKVDKNEGGMLAGALEDYKGDIQRESLSKQADLSVIQMAKQGKYDSAKEIADRAVEAKFERQKQKNDILQFVYEENKDLFNTKEQRLFETQQADRNRGLEMDAYKEKARYDQIIAQSDPLYQANLAGKIAENAAAVGGAISPDVAAYTKALEAGSANLAQVPEKIRGQVLANVQSTGTSKLLGLLGQYRDSVSGLNLFTANTPENKATLDSLKGQITAVYKQQQQLGTLDNGVQTLVDKIIPDPSKPSISALSNAAQIKAIDNFIKNQSAGSPAADPENIFDSVVLGMDVADTQNPHPIDDFFRGLFQ